MKEGVAHLADEALATEDAITPSTRLDVIVEMTSRRRERATDSETVRGVPGPESPTRRWR
ncbi:MAG TPA: hypothetical protein VND89_06575 [Acidimicrobiales bacterium]|nr:hypothetical protein [Acidimicrobiales bacterium]